MKVKELDKILRNLGFERTEEVITPPYGEHFRIIYSINDYEVEVEENKSKDPVYKEGVEKALEIVFSVDGSEIAYSVEVYRVVKFKLYIIHVFTGFENRYFGIYVWDKEELKTIAELEVNGGYIFVGCQKDLETLLPKLIKELNPFKITIF